MLVIRNRWCRNMANSQYFLRSFFGLLTIFVVFNVLTFYFVQPKCGTRWKDRDALKNVRLEYERTALADYLPTSGQRCSQQNGTVSCVKDPQIMIAIDEFRRGARTGNPLIDDYGKDDGKMAGGKGRGVVLTEKEKKEQSAAMDTFHVNVMVSDSIALNRMVPDSRIQGCNKLTYPEKLPKASVLIPFFDEWPSVLLRTVYSVINRSPRSMLQEIILIDDASELDALKDLPEYINKSFPIGLVRLVRNPVRMGLVNARLRGCNESTGDVLIIFDSHMEVNIDWLQPLLYEISADRHVVAMATLDYIQGDSFEYRYNVEYLIRYGWDWRLKFYETSFRDDQIGPANTSPRPGVIMVGAAFAIDKQFFLELGGYDEKMTVWGGENLEMSWRVWLCGGRLMHVPCSRIGHIARNQPYTFPGGRSAVEHHNYKRAMMVWMGNYTRFLYPTFPDMKTLEVGDLSSRLAVKEKLKCKDFSWYLQNVWQELNVPDENATLWGEVANEGIGTCLDNGNYLYQTPSKLYFKPCAKSIPSQAFTWTTDRLLRTSLQCLVAHEDKDGAAVELEGCIIGSKDKWNYTQNQTFVHEKTKRCMDVGDNGPIVMPCQPAKPTQKFVFHPINLNV